MRRGTAGPKIQRRLAAIFAADVEGYSRLMDSDEVGTLRALTAHREIMDRLIGEHEGRIANTAGDSILAEFPSVIDAVQAAVAIQEALGSSHTSIPEDRQVRFRIGVHVGDVMVKDGDLFGDGVNIAARLQAIAQPGGLCISESAYEYVRKVLGLAYEDLGPQRVKNIPESVRAFAVRSCIEPPTQVVGSARHHPKTLPLPDKPSIAVLPFTNMSGDPHQEYFADGITEEIIAALSRIRSLLVIARNSTFAFKGAAKDVRQIARELGVRYVLEGSVRRSGEKIRVTAELIDGSDGSHIWADRYQGQIEDVFDLQDRLTEAIVGALEPSIRSSEIARARRKRPDSLDAYDYVMRAMPAVWSTDPEAAPQALTLLERAMSLDPSYALAKSLASWCHAQQVLHFRSSNQKQDRERALAFAEEAARLDSDDPLVLTTLASAYNLAGRLDRASTLIERALRLDPNSAWAWQRSGWIKVYKAQPELALEHFERGLRISPFDPINFNSYIGMGAANLAAGRYEDAVRWLEKGFEERPSAGWAYRLLAPAYALAGRLEDARKAATLLLQSFPDFTIRWHCEALMSLSPELGKIGYLDRIRQGHRLAGLPE
jgi:adenylate cyclase